jgi:hypothetical protein
MMLTIDRVTAAHFCASTVIADFTQVSIGTGHHVAGLMCRKSRRNVPFVTLAFLRLW